MMLVIPDVLDPPALAELRSLLARAEWHDGRETAGYTAIRDKRNEHHAHREQYRECETQAFGSFLHIQNSFADVWF